jgi:hypothetical protein
MLIGDQYALWLGRLIPLLVHKQTSYPSWSRIEVLVCAPDRKVHIPVVQGQGHVSDTVGKVPSANASLVRNIRSSGRFISPKKKDL